MRSPEFALIDALVDRLGPPAPMTSLGPGDDAAIVAVDGTPVAITVDTLVDGVHFDRVVSSAADVGWKAVAVSVSDLAAVGARPRAAVVALHLPDDVDDAWLGGLYDGIAEAARRWGLDVVGGDVSAARELAIALTLVGGLEGREPMTRAGARPGEEIVLVGAIGPAAAALALRAAGAHDVLARHPELLAAHRRPRPHLDAGIALAATGVVTAAIDVSDGLGRDAAHVASASGVRLEIDGSALPVPPAVAEAERHLGDDLLAVGGGEDFALLATVRADALERVREAVGRTDSPLAVVGRVEEGSGVGLVRAGGRTVEIGGLGYEHGPGSGEGR